MRRESRRNAGGPSRGLTQPTGHLPVIRIHSDRKWPERIVYDTTLPTIVPVPTAMVEDRVPSPATVADVSVKKAAWQMGGVSRQREKAHGLLI
jgi:hypothetical protein